MVCTCHVPGSRLKRQKHRARTGSKTAATAKTGPIGDGTATQPNGQAKMADAGYQAQAKAGCGG